MWEEGDRTNLNIGQRIKNRQTRNGFSGFDMCVLRYGLVVGFG